MFSKKDFGEDFKWGVSAAAYQVEGAHTNDGKGLSIWDVFTNQSGKIYKNHNANHACDFYNRYEHDLNLMRGLNIPNFRYSISWSRILPHGKGHINQKGIDFYDKMIDTSLELGIEPWLTLYHWDLPYELERKGGWTNREIIHWFSAYAEICAKKFGDRIKHWMILNEPVVFTGAGYFLGIHAPGKKGLKNFIPAVHHAALAQSIGAKIVKNCVPHAEVGTTFSCSHLEPYSLNAKDIIATKKVDALLNRLFVEPALGLGYPVKELKLLERIYNYHHVEDEKNLIHDFDFIGLQNYTREIIKHSYFVPFVKSRLIKANKRNVQTTVKNWEVYPEAIYHMLKKYDSYSGIKKIIVTENGAAFHDVFFDGKVYDDQRVHFIKNYLKEVLRAQKEGVNVKGYFIWTFIDNFEWAEGFYPRFGIIHNNFESQTRTIKQSGYWYKEFLE